MIKEKLLQCAILNKEWHCAAHILIELYYEYVEGLVEESMHKYNRYIRLVDVECIDIIIRNTPFQQQAAKLEVYLDKLIAAAETNAEVNFAE